MLVWRQQLDGPHFLLLLLVFVAAGESLPAPALDCRSAAAGRELMRISLRWLAICSLLAIGLQLARLLDVLDLRVLLSTALTVPPLLWMLHCLSLATVARTNPDSRRRQAAAIVGVTNVGIVWANHLIRAGRGSTEVAFFDDRHADRLPEQDCGLLTGNVAQMAEFVRSRKVHSVYITLPISGHARIVRILESLRDCTASIYFVPDVLSFDLLQARVDCVAGVPVLAIRDSPFVGAAGVAKRAIDIVVSGAALLAFAVPMLAIAGAVRMTSKGPAIFRQRRYGLNGEEIHVLKFRTMAVVEDGATQYVQATRNDPRITRVGAFLRATSLDELPQLLNVFAGSMSIVGPRPHAIAVNERYRGLIPNYMVRHKVKPGITGLAQVNGCRGGDDLESMRRRIEYDLEYLRNWSLALDVSIILKTAAIVWNDRHAY